MPNRPNILLIFTDQQYAGAMSCTGNEELQTEAIDSLASNGVRFERAYCTQPLCSPARSSLITGLMPHQTGVMRNNQEIADHLRQQELGRWFSNAGYRCITNASIHQRVDGRRGGYAWTSTGGISKSRSSHF